MPPKRPRATLRTISEATGLSLSTVSLALRGGEKLREDTRQKVLTAARELGYQPDRAGVRLRTGRSQSIGLILDGLEDSVGFSRKLIHGISDEARPRGMALNVYPQFERDSTLQTLRTLTGSGQVDGLILTHTEAQDPRVKLLLEMDFPFVTHGRTELFTPHPYHDFDSARFVSDSLDALQARGVRSVMAVLSDNRTYNYHTVRRHFEDQMAARGLSGHVHEDPHLDAEHISAMRKLGMTLAATRPVEGLLCDSELVAISLATGLRDAGLTVGQDLHLVSKQTSDLLPALFPTVLGLREAVYASGRELARLLFERLDGAPADQLQTLAAPLGAEAPKG